MSDYRSFGNVNFFWAQIPDGSHDSWGVNINVSFTFFKGVFGLLGMYCISAFSFNTATGIFCTLILEM